MNHGGRFRWVPCFLGDLPFPYPPLQSGATLNTPRFTIVCSENPAIGPHGVRDRLENGVQLSPSTVTADKQCAVDIGIFVYKTVESSVQRLAHVDVRKHACYARVTHVRLPLAAARSNLAHSDATRGCLQPQGQRQLDSPRWSGGRCGGSRAEEARPCGSAVDGGSTDIPSARQTTLSIDIRGDDHTADRIRANYSLDDVCGHLPPLLSTHRVHTSSFAVPRVAFQQFLCFFTLPIKDSGRRGGVVVRLLASHLDELGSIPGGVARGYSLVRIMPDDIAGKQILSGIFRFPHPFIPALLQTHLASPSSPIGSQDIDFRGRGGVVVRLLASHLGEPGSIPNGVAPGFSHVGIVPDDAAGCRRVFSGISRFHRPFIRALFLTYLASPPSALKTTMFKAAQVSSLAVIYHFRDYRHVYSDANTVATERYSGATVAERLARSPPTKANRAQSPAGSPDFHKWESCRTMALVGGFSRGSPASPASSFRHCSIFTSITFIGSQDLAPLQPTEYQFEVDDYSGSEGEEIYVLSDPRPEEDVDRCMFHPNS
ncbi:hypothetical protein PR048_013803 [Dryococelus australis]|uniref:Uncharacterized protein n=1 Tax=Dryococelus australis TaxID=614101 RepID=A0ABQ9HU23_9NEOP|nr:hypothetical protein PR048_013803 [Dryococelus australis]